VLPLREWFIVNPIGVEFLSTEWRLTSTSGLLRALRETAMKDSGQIVCARRGLDKKTRNQKWESERQRGFVVDFLSPCGDDSMMALQGSWPRPRSGLQSIEALETGTGTVEKQDRCLKR
jgi:hypothetical protein